MKRTIFLILFFITSLCSLTFAESKRESKDEIKLRHRPFGLGLFLGDPLGATMAFRFTDEESLQIHVGWSFGFPYEGVNIVLDYRHHFMSAIPAVKDAGVFAPAIGVGAKVDVREGRTNPVAVGVRIPAQMSFFVKAVPIEAFLELALGMYVWPGPYILVDGGIGARWYF